MWRGGKGGIFIFFPLFSLRELPETGVREILPISLTREFSPKPLEVEEGCLVLQKKFFLNKKNCDWEYGRVGQEKLSLGESERAQSIGSASAVFFFF